LTADLYILIVKSIHIIPDIVYRDHQKEFISKDLSFGK